MKEIDFYRTITKELGVYSIFNSIREALFYQLASLSRIPVRYEELAGIITEDGMLHQSQVDFINESIKEGTNFRHYECAEDGLKIHYFVNMCDDVEEKSPIACHLQEYFEVPMNKISAISVIILYENHPRLFPKRYPKVIKHELSHAAIEFVIKGNLELENFYFSDENSKFIEFLCDLIPYLAVPSKKENGMNKYIDDSISCFGYDAEEEMMDFINIIDEVYAEDKSVMDLCTKESKAGENIPHFKSQADKYVFGLTNTDGKTRCKLVGITEDLYHDRALADVWYNQILSEILSGDFEKETLELATKNLTGLYENMIA